MFRKRNYPKQSHLSNFYDSTNPKTKKTKTSRKSRSKKIETFPSDADLCQRNPAFASTLVLPKDGMTDFNIFSRPEPDIPSILNCGLIFKLIDIKCYITEKNDKRESLHLYGVTENQSSVLVHVNDFSPSIIVGLQNMKPNQKIDLNDVQERINLILTTGEESSKSQTLHKPIIKIEALQRNSQQQDIPKSLDTHYLKFFLSHVKYVKELRKLLKSSTETYLTTTFKEIDEETETYFKLHFLKERNLSVFGWIFIEPEHIYCRPDEDRESLCQIEIDVTSDRLIPIPSAEGDNSTWPLRIVSFDLECETMPGEGFPRAERRPIIQIANTCRIVEQNKSVDFKNIFVVGSCAHIEGATIYSYSNDTHLLRNWRHFMLTFDPDIVIGYNIVGFDFRYISKRAQKLNIEGFFTLGRLKNLKHTSVIDPFVEKLNVDGRIIMDMPGVVRAECPGLDRYGLGAVSQALLGETKCDVAYSDLYAFQHGNALTRQKIAIYCIQDTNLPMKLLDKLNILPKYAYKVREMGILLPLVAKKSRYSNKNPKFIPKGDDGKGQVAKPPFKKFNRSATQAVGEFSGLNCLENVLETISGSNIFRVYIPALYKKQNYKLSYLSIKRMFIKVYNEQNLEMLAYLIGDAYENLHTIIEGVEEILVTKFIIEEPKPGRKILKIMKAMALDVNYKAVDVLRSINNITWINGQAFLSEFKNTKDFDLSVFKNLKKNQPPPLPLPIEKPKEDDFEELEFKEEWMDQVQELSQTSFNCQSNQLPVGEVQSSSQRLETGPIKRSQSHLNFEYPSQEYPLEEELDHDVRKMRKVSALDAKIPEEEKMVMEALQDSTNDLYLPMSVVSYPNVKWVIKCCDFSTHDESVAGSKVKTTNSQQFVRDLISRDYYRLTVVKNDNENSLDLNKMVLVEEVCVISSEDFWRIQDIMKVRARTPSEFALINTVFFDDDVCYLLVHSAAWNAGTTSSSQEVNMDLFRIFKLNTGFEHLLA